MAGPATRAVFLNPQFPPNAVELSSVALGRGGYGSVFRATLLRQLPCAAKVLHGVLMDPEQPRILHKFEQECRILSEIRHPNIVQFLGVSTHPQTGQTILLMELMDESLTHFLEQTHANHPVPYHTQINITHDITLAIAFLHSCSIEHRDLSSNNVLLVGAGFRAKVTDFGMSRLRNASSSDRLTQCPGTPVYMPPEAMRNPPVYTEKLDCFQIGVLMIQIMTRQYPAPSDRTRQVPDVRSPTGLSEIPIRETDRRQNHIQMVSNQPMYEHVLDCLKDNDKERPSAWHLSECLAALKGDYRYADSLRREEEGGGKVGQLQREVQRLVQQTGEQKRVIGMKDEEIRHIRAEQQREVQREVQRHQQQMAELNRQMHHMQVDGTQKLEQLHRTVQQRQVEIAAKHQALNEVAGIVQQQKAQINQLTTERMQKELVIEHLVHDKRQYFNEKTALLQRIEELEKQIPKYTCCVVGSDTVSATANVEVQVELELRDPGLGPCAVPPDASLNVHFQSSPCTVVKTPNQPSRFHVSFLPTERGQKNLSVEINGQTIPIAIDVYPDPKQLLRSKRIIPEAPKTFKKPLGIAFNSRRELLVCEENGDQVSVYSVLEKSVKRSFGGKGKEQETVKPRGVAVDKDDNVYVTSQNKLQKFSSRFDLLQTTEGGEAEDEAGKFDVPSGLSIFGDELFVCDRQNNRIQVFNLDLVFVRIASDPSGQPKLFKWPCDVKFDGNGLMYVAEYDSRLVQVVARNGANIRTIGQGNWKPDAIHIVNDHLYVSGCSQSGCSQSHSVFVYRTSGEHVHTYKCDEPVHSYGIATCAGEIYVCDSESGRIEVL